MQIHKRKYQIKLVKLNTDYSLGDIITWGDLKKLATKNGMILETGGDFLVISNYMHTPVLFARRCDL